MPSILSDDENGLTPSMRCLLDELWQEYRCVEARLLQLRRQIESIAIADDAAARLTSVQGIGQLTATAITAFAGNGTQFKSGRHLAAWLGLVPREFSTGGKQHLLGISKRGNPYLRKLLVHGARSCILHLDRTKDHLGVWIGRMESRGIHRNKVIVALANKLARVAWAVLTGAGGLYQANSLASPATWEEGLRDRSLMGKVDLIFTNPPFGSKIPVDDPALLEKYDLGHSWSYDEEADLWIMGDSVQKSQPPEILFIERCVKFLKPGTGRVAMVLPDGILGSPGLGYVRQWILKHTQVLASVDLHPDTFQPNVSVQTSVLVLQRKTDELIALEEAAGRMNDYSIFMAVANHVGHDKRGNTTYVRDKKGNEVVEEVGKKFKEYEDGRLVYQTQKTLTKVVDDNTLQIAQEFRKWLSEQD